MLLNKKSQLGYTQNRGGRNALSGMRARNRNKKIVKDTPTNETPDVKPENTLEEQPQEEPKAIETPEDKPDK